MASNRQWWVYFIQFLLHSDLRVVLLPSARRRIATIRRCWMPTYSLLARLRRLRVKSDVSVYPASLSTSLRAWKTVALQRAPCRPLPHNPPLRRHKQRPNPQTTVLRQMLTYATLLQSRES